MHAEFSAWQPYRIIPSDKLNELDVLELIRRRLVDGKFVSAVDIHDATRLMTEKSQVGHAESLNSVSVSKCC